jgi:integrase
MRIYRRGASYWGDVIDHNGARHRFALNKDKAAAVLIAGKLERLIAHAATGEPLPSDLSKWIEALPSAMVDKLSSWGVIRRATTGRLTELSEHVQAFERHLADAGRTPKHVQNTVARIQRVLTEAAMRWTGDLDAGRVSSLLAKWRGAGMATATSNHHVTALRMFTNWLVADGRLSVNPLAGLRKLQASGDRRRVRRALKVDEIRLLLQVTEGEPERFGMTGPDRALLYDLAIQTGLRANELRTLTRESFDLGDAPAVKVSAGNSKSRTAASVPLSASLAERLRERLQSVFPAQVVFPVHHRSARMLHEDMRAARLAWVQSAGTAEERRTRRQSDFLKAVSTEGRAIDFHALRHTTASLLAAGGVHPAIAQRIMRHATVDMTMNVYTHADVEQTRAAVEQVRVPMLAATGTDGRPVECASICATDGEIAGISGNFPVQCGDLKSESGSPQGAARMAGNGQTDAVQRNRARSSAGKSGGLIIHCSKSTTSTPSKTCGESGGGVCLNMCQTDPKLAALVTAWADLPEHIKAAVLALVDAGKGASND